MLDSPAETEAVSDFALERFMPYRLSILANRVSRALAGAYAERYGLTIPEWRVMAVLGRYPDITSTEIAERTAMDKVRVSRAVASLLEDGRLKRTSDREDRRRATLRLSRKGREVHRQIVPLARSYEAKLMASLNDRERAALDRLVEGLTAVAQELEPVSDRPTQ